MVLQKRWKIQIHAASIQKQMNTSDWCKTTLLLLLLFISLLMAIMFMIKLERFIGLENGFLILGAFGVLLALVIVASILLRIVLLKNN